MLRLYYRDSLWSLIAGPTIWAVHFLFCYIATAIYCAKSAAPATDFYLLQITIAVATVAALAGIVVAGTQAADNWHRALDAEWAADDETLRHRRRFVGRAAFLLSGLSAIATAYVGMTVLFVSSCQ